jgi:hypothetical protein
VEKLEDKIIEFMNFKQGRGTKSAYLYQYKDLITTAVEMRSCKDLAAFLKLTEKDNLVIKQKSEAELLQDIYEYTAREKRINLKRQPKQQKKTVAKKHQCDHDQQEQEPNSTLKVEEVAEAKSLAKRHFNKYLDELTPEDISQLKEKYSVDVTEAVNTIKKQLAASTSSNSSTQKESPLVTFRKQKTDRRH